MPHLSRLNSLALTIALVIGFASGMAAGQTCTASRWPQTSAKAPLPLDELRTFAEVMDRIKAAYVEPVDDKTLLENAIKGMLSNLDPHSAYLGPEDFAELQESTSGEFGGLGIEVGTEDGNHQNRVANRRHPCQQGRDPGRRLYRQDQWPADPRPDHDRSRGQDARQGRPENHPDPGARRRHTV
jgi:hypothetical protein